MKRVVVFLADGFEEVEAITPVDYMRRAGIEVCTVSLNTDTAVRGSHAITVLADTSLEALSLTGWDGVLLPGGGRGAENLAASRTVGDFLKSLSAEGKLVAAICASPAVVLAPLGLLFGRRFTCYPGMEERVSGATWTEGDVVVEGNIITSRGAGTAGRWAAALISYLVGTDISRKVSGDVLTC
jgi:4-methyl-5(b-hydroxyethyl)-thiazole monophosphate biosynthesis